MLLALKVHILRCVNNNKYENQKSKRIKHKMKIYYTYWKRLYLPYSEDLY